MGQHDRFLVRLFGDVPAKVAVGAWYLRQGFNIEIPATHGAPTAAQAADFFDSGDVFLTKRGYSQRWRVEVKHRKKIDFTCADDFPFSTVIVGKRESVDRATDAIAFISVSRDLRYAAIIYNSTRPHWRLMQNRPKNTGNIETEYVCPKELVCFERIAE